MENTSNKVRFSLTLPTDLAIKLDILKDNLRRNRNDLIINAIQNFLNESKYNSDIEDRLTVLENSIKELLKK